MQAKWSWVKGGFLLGVWNLLVFLSGNRLGTTTAYAQTAGYFTQFFSDLIPTSAWTAGTCGADSTLRVGWQWLLVLGIFLGGLLAKGGHRQQASAVPEMWQKRFGHRPRLRYLHAFIGGFLMLFGARMAGGCTSSHVISGMSQLAVSGLLFGGAVFAVGIPVAMLLYGKRGVQ
ncbi:MAG TPA: hypothetical protein DDZ55_06795 [Firmicutes bacterium]|nr:hypothetical protein [Bacillota bacterium]